MILEVVQREGPVAVEVVLRRVREQWGMNRAGSRARSAFDSALRALRRKHSLVAESDGFLALPGQTVVVRGGVRDAPATIRSIHEVSPSELRLAIVRFVEEVHSISEDELTARVSSVFGWNRRGADISNEFRRLVRKLVTEGILQQNGSALRLADEGSAQGA